MTDEALEALLALYRAAKEMWYGSANCGCGICVALDRCSGMEEEMTAPKVHPHPKVSREALNEELVMLRAKVKEQEAETIVLRRSLGSVLELLEPHKELYGAKMMELMRYLKLVSAE